MRHLVCQPRGSICKITIVDDASTEVKLPFETWTLRTGRRILFVERGLGRLLERHHLGGSFQQGALYGLAYDDMCAILTDKLGEHDRAVYERLLAEQEAFNGRVKQSKFPTALLVGTFCGGLAKLICVIVWKSFTLVVLLCVLPIVMSLVRNIGKR